MELTPAVNVPLAAITQLRGLVQWVGAGRPLTTTGMLRLADARHLVEELHTGDDEFAGIPGQHLRVRSSADLWNLQALLRWAKTARLVRVERGRLLPVKKNAHLADDPQALQEALLRSLQNDCKAYLGRYSWRSFFYEDAELGFETMWQGIPAADGPVSVAEIAAEVWDALTEHDDYPLQGQDLEQGRRLVRRDVDYLLARYADLGVLHLSRDRETVTMTESGAAWAADRFSPGILELRVTLDRVTDPVVWRRLQIADHWTLGDLARAVEDAMGWREDRGHFMTIGRTTYADALQFDADRDEDEETLVRVLEPGRRFAFVYDPDDGQWRHTITVERRMTQREFIFQTQCTDGAGACPIEDCSGPEGYAQLKALLAGSGSDRDAQIEHLLGYKLDEPFDPVEFTVEVANARLQGTR
ncbi:plasmid pRiA4b ORF-3 family protein (plasmid) [Streptomyces sp. NBC_01281]|uniref:plasmid pRiA4b ORF-3 family protein n=1 Tax=Streptomyces sp. NBC_01281 TaxID=2903811 RepID=UPI002E1380FE|nr:plasmid pRiA4b ORF-3 family protein [Streptomyces sp. NBC_01281]WSK66616.1 plasmid pRiA4b ORF-3 family protein [Streptomyces sp. NBC_01281]